MSNAGFLSSKVTLANHYRRSIKLDSDLGNLKALDGYICNRSARSVVESMSHQILNSGQRAFTWTGPYGGGKSSLALTFASALHPDEQLRKKAISRLDKSVRSIFNEAFPVEKGWLIVPVSGYKINPVQLIAAQFCLAGGKRIEPTTCTPQELIDALLKQANSKKYDGLLLVVDELGKLLEAATQGDGDINFFQNLAEAASRSNGKLVVVGILHQAFQQYVAKLSADMRADWSKVQGRYVDIPLIASSDEVVDLIGQAIQCHQVYDLPKNESKVIAEQVSYTRTGLADNFCESLEACWPLHPALAIMLGPISRRQFGQNERSLFGFLSSSEPYGFKRFLDETPVATHASYCPSNFWDYLKANLEPLILTSVDSHRWIQANEIVSKVMAKQDELLTSLIKNIAVIDLFRAGSGLEASEEVLATIYPNLSQKKFKSALNALSEQRVIIYRKHLNAWGLFEGSDFDIDVAVKAAMIQDKRSPLSMVKQTLEFHPILAKRHYYSRGSLRWMRLDLTDASEFGSSIDVELIDGELGKFLLVLPNHGQTRAKIKKTISQEVISSSVVAGIAPENSRVMEYASELSALQLVAESNHELVGDPVARKEVQSRMAVVKSKLEDEIRVAISHAEWNVAGGWVKNVKLSMLASEVADATYYLAPIAKNELINRDSLSTNAVKARRELIYGMLNRDSLKNLGLEGWPAERGLYESILLKGNLHQPTQDERWFLARPGKKDPLGFDVLWKAADSIVKSDSLVGFDEIYRLWNSSPYGIKPGLAPILLFTYLFAGRESLAIYRDKMFAPTMSEANIDEALKDPARFSVRKVCAESGQIDILQNIAEQLGTHGVLVKDITPLSVARGLVTLVFKAPEWTRRTRRLSSDAIMLRDTLLKANDPHKLLFIDLPELLRLQNFEQLHKAIDQPLSEIANSYGLMLLEIRDKLFQLLQANLNDLNALHNRAELVEKASSDLRLNAFAARIKLYDGSTDLLEPILSLAANKPSRLWNDSDFEGILTELSLLSTSFRHVETYAEVKGLPATRETFAVVMGSGSTARTVCESYDLTTDQLDVAAKVADSLVQKLKSDNYSEDLIFAALAIAGITLSGK